MAKFVILGNVDKPDHIYLEWHYQFEETFEVYLQLKNQFHPWNFFAIL